MSERVSGYCSCGYFFDKVFLPVRCIRCDDLFKEISDLWTLEEVECLSRGNLDELAKLQEARLGDERV